MTAPGAGGSRSGAAVDARSVRTRSRRVGKAKRAHYGRATVGTAREERAFAHPTGDRN